MNLSEFMQVKKKAGEKLVMVAVGEVLTATWAERAGVDIVRTSSREADVTELRAGAQNLLGHASLIE